MLGAVCDCAKQKSMKEEGLSAVIKMAEGWSFFLCVIDCMRVSLQLVP